MKMQFSIQWLEEVDSTNSEALRQLNSLANLSVLAANCQTAGRGQRGNKWLTHAGENLTFSIVIKFGTPLLPSLKASNQFLISEAAALGVHSYLASKSINSTIKWPNDVYVSNKKICGMLIENKLEGENVASSIVGIGLNVNQKDFPPQLVNPTSMRKASGNEYDLKEELKSLCESIGKFLEMISGDSESLKALYFEKLYKAGSFEPFVDCKTQTEFVGKIVSVSDAGILRVETKEGELKEFAFKEISYVI